MSLSRRALIGHISSAAGALALARPSFSAVAPADLCLVETSQGKLRGIRHNGVDTYLGVPYAGSVSGANRFKAPSKPPEWTGIRDALTLGLPSIQPADQTFGINEPAPGEDCLVLNIWAPSSRGSGRPVMFYSHGGGFTTGSAGAVWQDGANLAREHDVVVISSNHRLGLLGYLWLGELGGEEYAASGNQGLLDIVAALSWVGRNVEAFGGDPRNVMIFGESGGGAKTSALYALPQAAPFFNKASIESGPGIRMTERETAGQTTRLVLDALGLSTGDWRRLHDVPAPLLLDVQTKLAQKAGGMAALLGGRRGIGGAGLGGFGPVVDGTILPAHPFDPLAPAISKDKPLLVGGNEDEQAFFSMTAGDREAFELDDAKLEARLSRELGDDAHAVLQAYRSDRPGATPSELYIAIRSALFSGIGSRLIAERKTTQGGAPAYLYCFTFDTDRTFPGTNYRLGAMHALDIAFKFNNMLPVAGSDRPVLAGARPDRFLAGRNMSSFWANFARTGRPSAEGQPAWPAYSLADRAMMRIDVACSVVNDAYKAERLMWDQL